jgi:hypothetical protein
MERDAYGNMRIYHSIINTDFVGEVNVGPIDSYLKFFPRGLYLKELKQKVAKLKEINVPDMLLIP